MYGIKTVIEKIRRSGNGLKNIFFNRHSEKRIAPGKKNFGNVNAQKMHNKEKDYSVRYQSHIDHQWSGWDNIMK